MKILIAYHSNTENTKKVAISIKEGLIEEGQDVTLMAAKDIDPASLSSYDLLILGSGIYARKLGKSIIQLMRKAPELPSKIACFQTYGNLVWYPEAFDKGIGKSLRMHDVSIVDQFSCFGENIGMTLEQQKQLWASYSPEVEKAREEHAKKIKGHPNAEDLENAKAFAKNLIKL